MIIKVHLFGTSAKYVSIRCIWLHSQTLWANVFWQFVIFYQHFCWCSTKLRDRDDFTGIKLKIITAQQEGNRKQWNTLNVSQCQSSYSVSEDHAVLKERKVPECVFILVCVFAYVCARVCVPVLWPMLLLCVSCSECCWMRAGEFSTSSKYMTFSRRMSVFQ